MTLLLMESAIKVSLIVLCALLGLALLRQRSAALRHWMLGAALACAAAVPLAQAVSPAWPIPLGGSHQAVPAEVSAGAVAVTDAVTVDAARERGPVQEPGTRSDIVLPALASIWIAGAGLAFALLIIGLARLAWLRSRGHPVRQGPWHDAAGRVARAYGLRRTPRLLQSNHPALLATWGAVRPTVILPRGASAWPEDRIRVVLCHELAHVARGDWILQMLAEVVRAVYWFNPLLWLACGRLRRESERACDEAVLRSGVPAADYAAHLVDIARILSRPRQPWIPVSAMARPCDLEARIDTMLASQARRHPISRRVRLATLAALLAVTVPIAAAQTSLATLSGSVRDPFGGLVPDAALTLRHVERGTTHETRTSESGEFSFIALPPGEYALEIAVPGFTRLRDAVTVAGRGVERSFTLDVGSVMETISVSRSVPEHARRAGAPDESRGGRVTRLEARRPDACEAGDVGGRIDAPRKLHSVQPSYPEALERAGIGGQVVLEGRIATDGSVQDLQVLGAVHPELDREAIAAVSQWRYDTTLLNCEPIDVMLTVTIEFSTGH